jgi:hypothetical protein
MKMTILRKGNTNFIRFYSTIFKKSPNKKTIKGCIPIKHKSKENPQTILKEVPNYLINDNDVIFVSISDEKDKKDKYMEFNTYN